MILVSFYVILELQKHISAYYMCSLFCQLITFQCKFPLTISCAAERHVPTDSPEANYRHNLKLKPKPPHFSTGWCIRSDAKFC